MRSRLALEEDAAAHERHREERDAPETEAEAVARSELLHEAAAASRRLEDCRPQRIESLLEKIAGSLERLEGR